MKSFWFWRFGHDKPGAIEFYVFAFNIPQNSAGSSSWKRNKILALGVSGPCKRHAPIISFVRLDVQRMNLVM